MTAVAVLAALCGLLSGLAHRRAALLRQSVLCDRAANHESLQGRAIEFRYLHWGPATPDVPIMQAHYRRSEYFEALQRKYERAARYPWLPVAPDPPEPN
jgi:hypothetical protein